MMEFRRLFLKRSVGNERGGERRERNEKRDGRGESDADKAAVNRRRDVSAPLPPFPVSRFPVIFQQRATTLSRRQWTR